MMILLLQKFSDLFFGVLLLFAFFIIFSEGLGAFHLEKELSYSIIEAAYISTPISLVYFFLVGKLTGEKRNVLYFRFSAFVNLLLLSVFIIIFGSGI
jgi:hypothetical protein